jgi:hypothetical protein
MVILKCPECERELTEEDKRLHSAGKDFLTRIPKELVVNLIVDTVTGLFDYYYYECSTCHENGGKLYEEGRMIGYARLFVNKKSYYYHSRWIEFKKKPFIFR